MLTARSPRHCVAGQRHARFAGAVALALMLLAGCASTPELSARARQALPEQALLERIPFHGQRDYQCGPASLAMVLNASGVGVTVDTLIPQVFLPEREGSVQPEMLASVRRHRRIPFVLEGTFDALLSEIGAGHPVVVMQNLSLPAWPVWHYAVAIGFDRQAEQLILHSGMTPRQRTDFARFDATWARSNRWAFVALPPGELPATLSPQDALTAIADFERVQGTRAALPAWEALARRYPHHAMGQFALGNAYHDADAPQQAMRAFNRAVQADPTLGVAWLNLGLLRQAQGQHAAARRALRAAAELEGPWQAQAQLALDAHR